MVGMGVVVQAWDTDVDYQVSEASNALSNADWCIHFNAKKAKEALERGILFVFFFFCIGHE